eukprot:gene1116-1421_t
MDPTEIKQQQQQQQNQQQQQDDDTTTVLNKNHKRPLQKEPFKSKKEVPHQHHHHHHQFQYSPLFDPVLENERVRTRFITHEFNKLDRTQSRIHPPKISSDTESESDSEFFLTSSNNGGGSVNQSSLKHRVYPKQQSSGGFPSSNHKSSSSSSSSLMSGVNELLSTSKAQGKGTPTSASTTTSSTTATDLNKSSFAIKGLFVSRPSLLSSEHTGTSYQGFLNLLILISFRLVILNHLTYGIRIDWGLLMVSEWHRWPGVMIGLGINIFIILGYAIEKIASKRWLKDRTCYILRVINSAGIILVPSASIIAFAPNPASGVIVMILTCIFSMKIISYAYENSKQRLLHPDNSKFDKTGDTSIYPNNLSIKNIYWFMLVPTLVYQLSYPRSPRIRKAYLMRKTVEALILSALIFWMVAQYMVPMVQNTVQPMEQFDIVRVIERLPNLYVWLLGFYVFFHLYLNIVAELTRFGDREFYRDWWNSTGLDYFWRTWNLPVHYWIIVLIYTPLRRRKWSKYMCYFMCFFVSAVAHELVISVPFRSFKLWAFMGIMSQMILIVLTKNWLNGKNIEHPEYRIYPTTDITGHQTRHI